MGTGKCQMLSVLLVKDSVTTGVFESAVFKGPFSQCNCVSGQIKTDPNATGSAYIKEKGRSSSTASASKVLQEVAKNRAAPLQHFRPAFDTLAAFTSHQPRHFLAPHSALPRSSSCLCRALKYGQLPHAGQQRPLPLLSTLYLCALVTSEKWGGSR